jgi:putative transposase
MKYAWIEAHRSEHGVEAMCRILEVSRSGYYAQRKRGVSELKQRQEALLPKIEKAFVESHQTYGSPRIHQELKEQGEKVCENTVARWMREYEIRARRQKRFIPCTTDSNHPHPVAENLLDGNFECNAPNKKWTCDITYIYTEEGWLYLAGVMDLYSRKIVGWSMGDNLRAELVSNALKMALLRREPGPGLLHHSDRGVQYACEDYRKLTHSQGIVCSMSRTGNCYDNAAMESFWSTLKTEWVYRQTYSTRKAAQQSVFEYIETFYNRKRRHSSLGYVSPEAFEAARN